MTYTSDVPVAIVTGGSRGIGRAIAVGLGRLGMAVVINYHSNRDAADEAGTMVAQAGGRPILVQGDVGSVGGRRGIVDIAAEAGQIMLLVNNAGVAPKVRADLLDMPEESWDFVLDTNLKGVFFLTQLVANAMLDDPPPSADGATPRHIINIGSISAYTASINRGEYCVAKAGVGMLTQLFAVRLADHGINVYEIRPGVIETDMTGPVKAKYDKLILEEERGITPIRRWGQPEDIAKAVVAIASGMFPFSTGEVINVDGGFHLKTL